MMGCLLESVIDMLLAGKSIHIMLAEFITIFVSMVEFNYSSMTILIIVH